MTLKEYAESINELAKQYPDLLVVYASDDEGNDYQKVNYAGTVGFFEGNYRGSFIDEETAKDDSPDEYADKQPNAVCVN